MRLLAKLTGAAPEPLARWERTREELAAAEAERDAILQEISGAGSEVLTAEAASDEAKVLERTAEITPDDRARKEAVLAEARERHRRATATLGEVFERVTTLEAVIERLVVPAFQQRAVRLRQTYSDPVRELARALALLVTAQERVGQAWLEILRAVPHKSEVRSRAGLSSNLGLTDLRWPSPDLEYDFFAAHGGPVGQWVAAATALLGNDPALEPLQRWLNEQHAAASKREAAEQERLRARRAASLEQEG